MQTNWLFYVVMFHCCCILLGSQPPEGTQVQRTQQLFRHTRMIR